MVYFFVNLVEKRALCQPVLLHHVRPVDVELWWDEVAFARRNPRPDAVYVVLFLVQVHLVDDGRDDALGVVRIVDGEVAGVADVLCLHPQYFGKKGVERARPDPAGSWPDHFFDAGLHLPCGLVGEGQRHDFPGRHARLDDMGDAVGEHPRLTGAGACHHEHGAVNLGDGLALDGVEFVEVRMFYG